MNLVRDLERRLERLVEGVAGKVFRGSVHPSELAARIARESDLGLRDTDVGPVAPNQFSVHLNDKDVAALAEAEALNRELEHAVEVTAFARGWRLEGPARVWIEADTDVGAGSLRVVPTEVPGARSPWAHLVDAEARYPVTVNRCLIGRSTGADVSLPADTVSRRHALLWQEDGETWIYDLGSANGTYVNGLAATEPLAIEPGQRITLGAVPYVVNPA